MRRSKRKDDGETQVLNEAGVTFQIVSVQRNGRADNSRPRIQFTGNWLSEIGFVNGALVQSMPEPGGFVFNLCNENISNYSDLFNETREKGGTLIRVYINNDNKQAGFVTTGRHISKSGLEVGDALVAKCEQGCIRVRKVSGNIRLIYVARAKNERTGVLMPKVFMIGDWLNDLGFTSDTLMTVASEPGCITFTAHDKAIIYSEVVKYARQNKMQLVQVSTKDGSPLISVQGSCASHADFSIGEIFVVEYEHGSIKLQKLDPQRFGFPEAESPGN